MRQIAYPAALGSCVFGVGAQPLWAAEWSIEPNYSASVDYDSNRRLTADRKGSEASVLAIDLKFKRALEDLQLTLEPRYALRRFSDSSLGNGDDRSVNGGLNWVNERSILNWTGSYWDQSTLVTELLQTGIVSGDTHRRMAQTGGAWTWNHTQRRASIAQLNYSDVSYYGQSAKYLPGYRYSSGTVGERFFFTERGSFTFSTFGSRLQSPTPGNSSHEFGLQTEVIYAFSEQTNLDASIGESRRVLGGSASNGTNASVSLTHSFYLGRASLDYTRSLVPYGTGFLVEQQQFTASFSRPLTPYLDANLAVLRVQSNQTAVLLNIDRRTYNSVAAGLNWHPAETWAVGARVEGIRTQLPGPEADTVRSWRSSVTVSWFPFPKSRSW